jgi:hypothetical protein
MFNSPYAKGGMQTNGPAKPEYASGGDLNQNPGGMQQAQASTQQPWNQWGYFGQTGGMSGAYTPVGGGFQEQQAPQLAPSAPAFGQPGQATNAPNPSVPAGPTMPRFQTGTTIGNGADNPRRFMQRPSLSPQQMQQLTRGGQRPPANAYTPGDGYIELPPGPVGY